MAIKIHPIEKLDPANCIDVARWFSRYEHFIDNTEGKLENEEDRFARYMRYLPLFLAGDALLCYEEMYEADKEQYGVVKAQLCEFYGLDATTAYSNFTNAKFEPGSSVDAFIAMLRKYAGALDIGKFNCDKLIMEQFLRAIPAEAAAEIRGRCGGESDELQLVNVLRVARHMPSLNNPAPIVAAITERPKGERIQSKGERRGSGSYKGWRQRRENTACFMRGGDHFMRDCPHVAAFRQSLNAGNGTGPAPASGARLDRQ